MVAEQFGHLEDGLGGRYRLERELGRGGMGTVYLAHDLKHGRRVALKVLAPNPAAPLAPERFQREIRFAARLQHPHILTIHDSGAAGDCLWFTMPYVEGETLRQRLLREKQLPIDTAVRLTYQVARALDYAHRQGLVHRDIKPENILLSTAGDALVADFGIGKALAGPSAEEPAARDPEIGEPVAAEENITQVGAVVGTPRYMSLEQADGAPLDGRADIYSLGVVLYEALAGSPPFAGTTPHAIVAQQLKSAPQSLRVARDAVPPELDAIAMRMLARDRADRFASAGELADALDGLGRPSVVPIDAAHGGRRWWVAGAILSAAVLALGVGLLRRRIASPPDLQPAVVAVAPFDVYDPTLAVWSEGLVDLLSRNLDGAGPIRSVPPTVVVRRWAGPADAASAGALGRRTGAGLALYGSLLRTGRDSASLRASLLDVSGERVLGEWEVGDAAERMDRLADSLTLRVLRDLGRSRPIGAVRLAGLGATSLPALKAFLQGEQHHRRSEWDSALTWYQRAIDIDTGFAPALRRMGTTIGWMDSGFDSLSNTYIFRAGANNHGLPTRDSLLIAADSLFASLLEAGPLAIRADTGWAGRLRRVFATLDLATSRYPDDPEAWFLLGDAHAHFGPFRGGSYQDMLAAFDRAIALDSTFAPSYIHAIQVAPVMGTPALLAYLRPYLALAPHDAGNEAARLVERLLDSARGSVDVPALAEGASDRGLIGAYTALTRLPDSAALNIALARTIGTKIRSVEPFTYPGFAKIAIARAYLSRGRFREAAGVVEGTERSLFAGEAALLGALPPARASALFQARLSGPANHLLVAAFPWWASRGDTASLREASVHADSLARRDPDPAARAQGMYAASAAGAYLALAREDTAAALARLMELPEDACPACYLDRFTLARLLVERRRDREAWEVLRGEHPWATLDPVPTEVLWALLRGRVAERLGERDRAIQSYGWVVGMWRDADPGLQGYVREARDGLARLTAEPR